MLTFEYLRREPDIRSFKRGELIFKEGDSADCMYAVVDGSVDIDLHGKVVEHISPGGVFGEMAIIDGQPRSATAVAAEECRLAVINEKRFLRLVELMPPFALQMMKMLAQRLRRQDAH